MESFQITQKKKNRRKHLAPNHTSERSRSRTRYSCNCHWEFVQQDTRNRRQLLCVGGGWQHLFFFAVMNGDSCLSYRVRSGVVRVLQAISKGVPIFLASELETRILSQ